MDIRFRPWVLLEKWISNQPNCQQCCVSFVSGCANYRSKKITNKIRITAMQTIRARKTACWLVYVNLTKNPDGHGVPVDTYMFAFSMNECWPLSVTKTLRKFLKPLRAMQTLYSLNDDPTYINIYIKCIRKMNTQYLLFVSLLRFYFN